MACDVFHPPSAPHDAPQLNKDEMSKLSKAFQDKEFIKLFADYANEVSDPKNREENEAYLRQLEDEGRAEEVYGKGSQLIVPEPDFVLKTRDLSSREKFFVNLCTNEKVAAASASMADGGEHWSIPFSLGAAHQETDKGGKARPPTPLFRFLRERPCTRTPALRPSAGRVAPCLRSAHAAVTFCFCCRLTLSVALSAQPCTAAEFCVSPETLKVAKERPRFMARRPVRQCALGTVTNAAISCRGAILPHERI